MRTPTSVRTYESSRVVCRCQGQSMSNDIVVSLISIFPSWIVANELQILVAILSAVLTTLGAAGTVKLGRIATAIGNEHLQAFQVTNWTGSTNNRILVHCKQS